MNCQLNDRRAGWQPGRYGRWTKFHKRSSGCLRSRTTALPPQEDRSRAVRETFGVGPSKANPFVNADMPAGSARQAPRPPASDLNRRKGSVLGTAGRYVPAEAGNSDVPFAAGTGSRTGRSGCDRGGQGGRPAGYPDVFLPLPARRSEEIEHALPKATGTRVGPSWFKTKPTSTLHVPEQACPRSVRRIFQTFRG